MTDWPRAVLFDFDGVIVNSEPLHFMAFFETLAAEKIDLGEEEYYREMIGFDDRGCFKFIFQKRGRILDPRTFLRVMTTKKEKMMELIHRRQYRALPGAEEFIRGLWRNYPLAICSGALRDEIETMLEGVSLRDCFSVIVAAEDVTHGKPHPEGYLLATKLLGDKVRTHLKPADCLVVEDAPSVIHRLREEGFPSLGVATTYPLDKLGEATYVVETLEPRDVLAKIGGLRILE